MKNSDRKATWTEIGAAWSHKDGTGFDLKYTAQALPGAKIVLRAVEEKPEEEPY